jgi:hypothetical protein
MQLKALGLVLSGLASSASAHELLDASRGLAVHIEDLGTGNGVNGMPVEISRAVGPAVPALAERLIRTWRESSPAESVRLSQCCGWSFAGQIKASRSRVIQWRTTASGAELLWSSLRLDTPTNAAPVATVPLIPQCAWTTPTHGQVAGREFVQLAAHCRVDASVAITLASRRIASQGWSVQQRSRLVVQAELGGVHVQLTAGPSLHEPSAASSPVSSLVLVESRPAVQAYR